MIPGASRRSSPGEAYASVVVPAHNERKVIARLLDRLVPDDDRPDLEVLVVCNGCTDDTAEIARRYPGVRVLSTPDAGKAAALRLGDTAAAAFPRIYVDADVELGRADLLALCLALDQPGVLAVAPARTIPRTHTSIPVRMYYDVWEQLPAVRQGLFGRGVVALSQAGHDRLAQLPPVMADDLAMSSAFGPTERRVVDDATVIVHPPRTWSDLMRRRVRAVTGTRQVYEGAITPVTDSRTTRADLVSVLRRRPTTAVEMPVFLAAAVVAKRRAAAAVRAGDYSTWLRDESSRTGPSEIDSGSPSSS